MMDSSAQISDCGKYRYSLHRVWDKNLPVLGWVMLNPSTADASADDPTIRRCVGFARQWGYGGIDVRNLFAWRATDPKDMVKLLNPSGEENDAAIQRQYSMCHEIIAAWGKPRWPFVQRRARVVAKILLDSGALIKCLGVNGDGSPKHPLYLAEATERIPFNSSFFSTKAGK